MRELNSVPRLARPKDRPELEELWACSFHDDPARIRNFLHFMAQDDRTVVLEENGNVVAAAYLLPCRIGLSGSFYPAYCLSAAATLPDYRNRGCMSRIIRYCKDLGAERGKDFLLAVPPENDLYRFFSQFGFRPCLTQKTLRCSRDQLAETVASLASPELSGAPEPDRTVIRQTAFAGLPFVDWDRAALKYIFFEHTWSGGKSILSADGYALYKKSGTTATVTELCAGSDPAALTGPLLRTGAEDFVLCLPAGSPAAGKRCQTRRAGMAVPLTKTGKTLQRQLKDLYIGFTL